MSVNVTGVVSALLLLGCSSQRDLPSASSESSAREVVVATTITAAELVTRRVCLDQDGLHVLEAEAAAQNMVSGFLVLDDGSAESANVASVMRFANHPQRVRSETVALHAGEPCHLVRVDTGIEGVRATTRLIRLDPDSRIDEVESPRENARRQNLIDTLWVYEEVIRGFRGRMGPASRDLWR